MELTGILLPLLSSCLTLEKFLHLPVASVSSHVEWAPSSLTGLSREVTRGV